jgi:alkanesulfonate monooxygenase SsuD/methylene tetrahydromethanopterin reductase-like flavin-dependent oxidoreductase (luciferase family)
MLAHWAATPPDVVGLAEAERLGFDSVWTAETYGSDASLPIAVRGRWD